MLSPQVSSCDAGSLFGSTAANMDGGMPGDLTTVACSTAAAFAGTIGRLDRNGLVVPRPRDQASRDPRIAQFVSLPAEERKVHER